MRMSTPLIIAAPSIAIALGIPSLAGAQSKGVIAENEGLLIDGTRFSITSGKTTGEGGNLIKKLDARDLGPGAIIFRVGNRTGMATGKTPFEVEMKLDEVVPAKYKLHAHHWLILHGRYVCVARRPLCEKCLIADLCKWPAKTVSQ